MGGQLRDPSDPAWQFIGIIISALGVIVSIFSLPDSTRLPGIIVGFGGLIVCFAIARRSRKAQSTTISSRNDKTLSPQLPQVPFNSEPQKVSNLPTTRPLPVRNASVAARSNFFSTLVIHMILIGIFGALIYLFPNGSGGLSVIFILFMVSIFIIFIILLRRIIYLSLNNIVKNKTFFWFSIALIIVLIVIIAVVGQNPTEVGNKYTSLIGVDVVTVFLLAEAVIVIITIGITAGIKAARKKS